MIAQYHGDTVLQPKDPRVTDSLEVFLDFAIRLTEALDELHSKSIRHGALRPNIISMSEGRLVWIQDFGFATYLIEGDQNGDIPVPSSNLSFVAPECLGRINRPVDLRSDLYSLGATLFTLVTGEPFRMLVKNDVEFVHSSVITQPPSIGFHPVVDAIILKLLAKSPEKRYQTCAGLLSDWKHIQERPDSRFLVGASDKAGLFAFPTILFGREVEMSHLSYIYRQTRDDQRSQLVFVAGHTGVGKSTLVNTWAQSLQTDPHTVFCCAKYTQKNSLPLSGIARALNQLVRQIISQSTSNLRRWRRAIQSALGDELPFILSLVPDLVHLGGPSTSEQRAPLVDPVDQEARQERLIKKLLRVFTERRTVVMFLDDLEWASIQEITFLATVVSDFGDRQLDDDLFRSRVGFRSMILVCAYRDNVVRSDHPVRTAFEDPVRSHKISLKPLTFNYVERILTRALSVPWEECEDLSQLIYARTRGSPSLLHKVYELSTCMLNSDVRPHGANKIIAI